MNHYVDRIRAPFAAQGYTGLHLEWVTAWRVVGLAWAWLTARVYLRGARSLGRLVFAHGRPDIHLERAAELRLGEDVRLHCEIHRTRLSVRHKARLIIGDRVLLNGCIIAANTDIIIGNGVTLGPWAHLMDGDFHGVQDRDASAVNRPIIIEDDAWLATRAMVLKGVTIGRGAVVAAGAVVTKDVEPYTVVAGVPAVVVKRLRVGTQRSLQEEIGFGDPLQSSGRAAVG